MILNLPAIAGLCLTIASFYQSQTNNNILLSVEQKQYLEVNLSKYIINGENSSIKHTDNRTQVDSFIQYLGDDYFHTTTTNNTKWSQIPVGYENYYSDHGFSNIKCEISKNYNEYVNSIYRCAIPVPVDIMYSNDYSHDILGIGYREIYNSSETERFLITNYAANDTMEEVMVSTDIVRQFDFLHN